MRDKNGRFLPGQTGNEATQLKPGHAHRWQRGQSGNPAGVARGRAAFERAFYEALIAEGSPEEASSILWQCARARESWAVQLLLQRLAPQDVRLRVTHEESNDGTYDLTKLTDTELQQFIELAGRAAASELSNRAGGDRDAFDELPPGGESPAPLP